MPYMSALYVCLICLPYMGAHRVAGVDVTDGQLSTQEERMPPRRDFQCVAAARVVDAAQLYSTMWNVIKNVSCTHSHTHTHTHTHTDTQTHRHTDTQTHTDTHIVMIHVSYTFSSLSG